jgi:hypothetical protein
VTPTSHEEEEACSIKWNAPPVRWYKANWDAAFDKHTGRVGVGVVVRDSQGKGDGGSVSYPVLVHWNQLPIRP